jgi:hypothetical protein
MNTKQAWEMSVNQSFNDGSWKILLSTDYSLLGQDRWSSPGTSHMSRADEAVRYLGYGISISLTKPDHAYVKAFIEVACEIARRSCADILMDPTGMFQKASDEYKKVWLDLADAMHGLAKAFGRRCLADETLELSALHRASLAFERSALDGGGGYWDQVSQSKYLLAVELALAGGDLERARALIKVKKGFTPTKARYVLWRDMLASLQKPGAQSASTDPTAKAFSDYFNTVRWPVGVKDLPPGPPRLDKSMFILDQPVFLLIFSLIRDRYLCGHTNPEWRRVLNHITE